MGDGWAARRRAMPWVMAGCTRNREMGELPMHCDAIRQNLRRAEDGGVSLLAPELVVAVHYN